MRITADCGTNALFAGFVSLALSNCAISRVQIPNKDQNPSMPLASSFETLA